MAATMKVYFDWGGSDDSPGTTHNVTDNGSNKVRFKTADDATLDVSNPIPIPETGTNRSYWKQIYLKCTDDTGLTQIDNVKIYSDGSGFGAGLTLNVGSETPEKTSISDAGYAVAVGTAGQTGRTLTEHTDITTVEDIFGYTSGSPKDVSISESSSIIDAVNETTDYVVFQLDVGSTASPGVVSSESLTFKYDEI